MKMFLSLKSLSGGIITSFFLELIFASYWLALLAGLIVAVKVDKDVDASRGLIYGAIIGIAFGLFCSWRDGDYGTSFFALIGGLIIIGIITGVIGGFFGMLIKRKEQITWFY